ncbi:MAG: UDP-N-acetylenolpyruvoylglucosamine reductase, partial [Clostridia bacterium]|nr:UDP-N-acetylenolpyruvoylglucosamine reductase [Clostridia bacterium]
MNDFANLLSELRETMPVLELRENEPMKDHCSFRIGGPARVM